MRTDLVAELDAYCAKAFRKGKVLYNLSQQGEDAGHQVIEISCHNNKLDSFWSGEWQSTWTLNAGKLSGDLKIRCHYFEMGNIQFNLDKTFEDVAVKDATSAKDIVEAIKKVEDKVSQNLILPFVILVSTGPGRNVHAHPGEPAEANQEGQAGHWAEVRLEQTGGLDQVTHLMLIYFI